MQTYACDVAVIGGGMGGVAAALAAADGGASVLLASAFDWLGGQMTSQGVSALDEHRYIEQFGGTRSYYRMREAIRAHYRARGAPATMPDGRPLNPGNGWVSHLCFEPAVGAAVLDAMLAGHVAAGRLTVLRRCRPIAATLEHDRVVDVTLVTPGGRALVRADVVLDATELGDLLPLTGAAYVTGAEARSDTGEPHAAADGARPAEVQSFTFAFAVEHRPGEDHTIAKPRDYERMRDEQPYSLVLFGHDGEPRPFRMFEDGPTGLPPFWTYRRLLDAELLGTARDIAMINWHGNDYAGGNLLDAGHDERERIIDEAKRLALGFLYWLQTGAPRDDGTGHGYPGLRLLPEVMGSGDGLSQEPYIREARRIVARKRIVEGEIAAAGRSGARAEPFADSAGVGWYSIDLHPCVGNPATMYAATLPFQIPLGALLPARPVNLIAAAKNIGTTHLTNGAYRLHPVEWNIGEAAGALAAYCAGEHCLPQDVYDDIGRLRRVQRRLLERGVPLAWTIDLGYDDPVFVVSQLLLLEGAIAPHSPRFQRLELGLDQGLSGGELLALCAAAERLAPGVNLPRSPRWNEQAAAMVLRDEVSAMLAAAGVPDAALGEQPTWREVVAALARINSDTPDTPALAGA